MGWAASPVPIRITGERQSPDPNPVAGERISEYRHQMAVGGEDRSAQIGTGHAELTGQTRSGEVFDLAGGRRLRGFSAGHGSPQTKSAGSTDRVHVQ